MRERFLEVELERARARLFVGRGAERARFETLLAAPSSTPTLLLLHGPGGIGKTTLLQAFARTAEEAGVGFARLDARHLPPTPVAVAGAVKAALAAGGRPRVLAIDHLERLSALDGWLREQLLPTLPADLVLVLAGRNRPGPAWQADPGVRSLVTEQPLRGLEEGEVEDYLTRRGLEGDQRKAARDFARGHPLALALAADQLLRAPGELLDLAEDADLVRKLVQWLLRDVTGPDHREAAQACATVWRATRPVLAALIGEGRAEEAYDWLARQSFVEVTSQGLVMHDLVRDAVIRELRARDLAHHHRWVRAAMHHYLSGLEEASELQVQQNVREGLFALRYEPFIRRHYEFDEPAFYLDAARCAERAVLADVVATWQGERARAWFEEGCAAPGAELYAVRDATRRPVGLALVLSLEAEAGPLADDPAIPLYLEHLRHHAPLREGERAILVRFALARDTGQARSPVWSQLLALQNSLMFRRGAGYFGAVLDRSRSWEEFEEVADAHPLPGTAFDCDGHGFVVYGHDVRAEPGVAWARNCMERMLAGAGSAPVPSFVVLGREAFAESVIDALEHFRDDGYLEGSPLLRTRVLAEHAGSPRGGAELRQWIEQVSRRELAAGEPSLHRVLDVVYFRPAVKRLAAAHALHVAERTLRRRRREAVARLTEVLWRREKGVS